MVAGRILLRRVGGLDRRRTLMQVARVSAASLACAGAMVAVVAVLSAALAAGQGRALAELVLGGGIGLAVFLALARAMHVEDLALFRRFLPAR